MINKIHVLFTCIILLVLTSCDNEPYEGDIILQDNSCELAQAATIDAAGNFNSATDESYNLLCQAYRDALQDQIDLCGDENGVLQLIITNLDNCNADDTDLCEEAIVSADVAQIEYENATEDREEELCNNYREAIEYQIEVCGDSDSLQAILDELDDCQPEFVGLIGIWKLEAWNTDMARDIDNDGVVTNNYLEEIDCYNNETIEFYSNNTGTFFYRSVADITYTPNGNSASDVDFFITCTDIDESVDFTWVETANTVEITTVNGTELSYLINGNSINIGVDDGFSATSTVDGESMINERVIFVYLKI